MIPLLSAMHKNRNAKHFRSALSRRESDRLHWLLPLCPLDQSALAIPPEKTGRPRCQKEQRAEERTRNSRGKKSKRRPGCSGFPVRPEMHWRLRTDSLVYLTRHACSEWWDTWDFFPSRTGIRQGASQESWNIICGGSVTLESLKVIDLRSKSQTRKKGGRETAYELLSLVPHLQEAML